MISLAYTEADVIAAVQANTPLSVQTTAQAATTPATNTTARLLYNSASRTQGNFTRYYAQAVRQLAKDLNRFNLQIEDAEKPEALAYLIWDFFIKKFPDWEAQNISLGSSESVTRAKPGTTSAKAAYMDFLRGAKRSVASTPAVGEVDDYTNYPENMHPSPIGGTRLAGVED